jgi:hypothetical protein
VGGPLYFPFELSERRPIRPMQGYLFKLPTAFLALFLSNVQSSSSVVSIQPPISLLLGDEYRPADEEAASAERDPFAIDPALVERGIRGHAITQNALASYLRSLGLEPLSPRMEDPNFDIAWRNGERVFVAEIKSLTNANEEKQLRLGLGQVLRYAQQMRRLGSVSPVLLVERRPSDESWSLLCREIGVILVWPDIFERLRH